MLRLPKDAPLWAFDLAREIEAVAALSGQLPVYSASKLPDPVDAYNTASKYGRIAVIAVYDDATVGPTIAWSNGTTWKRPNAVGTVS